MSADDASDKGPQPLQHAGVKLIAIASGGFFLLLVAIALVPTVLSVDYMFTMGAVLLALPVISLLIGVLWARGLSVNRSDLGHMTEDEVRRVEIAVGQRFPADLVVEFADALPRWLECEPRMPVSALVPRGSYPFSYNVRAIRRGVYTVGPLRIRVCDPLGLGGVTVRSDQKSSLVVYPKPLPVESWSLMAGSASMGMLGRILGRPSPGASAEFYGARKYYPGDDLRRVHWRSAARARELIVKEFRDEVEASEVIIAIDAQSGYEIGEGPDSSLDYAARAAAYISERAVEVGGRVSLLSGHEPGRIAARAESVSELWMVMEYLAGVQADAGSSLCEILAAAAPHMRTSSALVLIGSRTDEPLRAIVQRLQAQDVAIAQIYVDPESFGPRPYTHVVEPTPDWLLGLSVPCWVIKRGAGK